MAKLQILFFVSCMLMNLFAPVLAAVPTSSPTVLPSLVINVDQVIPSFCTILSGLQISFSDFVSRL